MVMPIAIRMATLLLVLLQSPARPETAVLARYVEAIGGEAALRAVRSRVTEGQFDNGRGMNVKYHLYEQAPDHRATVLESAPIAADRGSGRGFDGTIGWDKNFIGTGVRSVEGAELADLKREADVLRPLHLLDPCASVSVETSGADEIVTCRMADGKLVRFGFQRETGLLVRQVTDLASGRGTVTVMFEDYRVVDSIRLPFRTQISLPGATVTYTTSSVRHNAPIPPSVFARPAK
jgi:hypothetical protein